MMTPDEVMILSNGMMIDRDTITVSLNGNPPWDSYDIFEPYLVDLGETATALVYRASVVRAKASPSSR